MSDEIAATNDYYQFYFGNGVYENTVQVRKNRRDITDFVVGADEVAAWREMMATRRAFFSLDKLSSFRLELHIEQGRFFVDHYRLDPRDTIYYRYAGIQEKPFDTLAEAWAYMKEWTP